MSRRGRGPKALRFSSITREVETAVRPHDGAAGTRKPGTVRTLEPRDSIFDGYRIGVRKPHHDHFRQAPGPGTASQGRVRGPSPVDRNQGVAVELLAEALPADERDALRVAAGIEANRRRDRLIGGPWCRGSVDRLTVPERTGDELKPRHAVPGIPGLLPRAS